MFGLFTGYKTFGLVGLAIIARVAGGVMPQYSAQCEFVAMTALSLTPATIRMAINSLSLK